MEIKPESRRESKIRRNKVSKSDKIRYRDMMALIIIIRLLKTQKYSVKNKNHPPQDLLYHNQGPNSTTITLPDII